LVRISTIVTVFNYERFVGEAIESVLTQTRKVDEVIVVNDGSTDGTAAVLAAFEKHINIINQPNSGEPAALNAALSIATGDVLTFLDADDLWNVDKTKTQCEILTHHPSVEAVFGMVQQFVSEDSLQGSGTARPCRPPQPGVSKITMMIRRASFERVGAFNEAVRHAEFVEWYTRAVTASLRTTMLDRVVAMRRIHDRNKGIVNRREQSRDTLYSLKQMLSRRRQ